MPCRGLDQVQLWRDLAPLPVLSRAAGQHEAVACPAVPGWPVASTPTSFPTMRRALPDLLPVPNWAGPAADRQNEAVPCLAGWLVPAHNLDQVMPTA